MGKKCKEYFLRGFRIQKDVKKVFDHDVPCSRSRKPLSHFSKGTCLTTIPRPRKIMIFQFFQNFSKSIKVLQNLLQTCFLMLLDVV